MEVPNDEWREAECRLFVYLLTVAMKREHHPLTIEQHGCIDGVISHSDRIPGDFCSQRDLYSSRRIMHATVIEFLRARGCPMSTEQDMLYWRFLKKSYPLLEGDVSEEYGGVPKSVLHMLTDRC